MDEFGNYSNCISTNQSNSNCSLIEPTENLFFNITIITCCLIATFINVLVVASLHWIQGPLNPTLKISLSLAAADAFASILYSTGSLPSDIASLLPQEIELIKLAGILITVVHLLALSFIHYLGILKPLHYNSLVTRRKVAVLIVFLWILPIVSITILFFETDLNSFSFRMTYTCFFIIPIIMMAFFYTHIIVMVRKQQIIWKNLSRSGSTRWKGSMLRPTSENFNRLRREQKEIEGNVKAIYTTLLIMGSCFIGWTPALLMYTLFCKNCLFNEAEIERIHNEYFTEITSIRLVENMLVVLKMLANPIIYSIRMKEVKDSTTRMYYALTGICFPSQRHRLNYRMASQNCPNTSTPSLQIRITSLRVNGGAASTTNHQTDVNTLL